MTNRTTGLSDDLHRYMLSVGVREHPLLARLREETAALPNHQMQIAPEQGAFMAFLVEALGARRCLELGTFTGYSSLAVALALPPEASIVCCDVSEEWTQVARRYWRDAGVEDKVDLRIAPALETLAALAAAGARESFDFAFIDADKEGYPAYYEAVLDLLRPGGVMLIDNVFWGGEIANPEARGPSVEAVRSVNARAHGDERVSLALLPIADGLTLIRKR